MDRWKETERERELGLQFSEAMRAAHQAKHAGRLRFIFDEEPPEELQDRPEGDDRGA